MVSMYVMTVKENKNMSDNSVILLRSLGTCKLAPGPTATGSPIIHSSLEKKSSSPVWNNVTRRKRFDRNQSSGMIQRLHKRHRYYRGGEAKNFLANFSNFLALFSIGSLSILVLKTS